VVFSQFNNDGTNHYTELPRKNIDTGAGLERLASIFQGTPTNFETDLFFPTIQAVEKMSDQKYSLENYQNPTPEQTAINTAFKVIADHVRAVAFAIADGAFPSNKDRGYVIRRLIRRADVYGRKLGIDKAFLYKLVPNVVDAMGEFYPDLKTKEELITKTIQDEENKFLKTLTKGYEQLTSLLEKNHELSAADGLFLFESFGFPVELSAEIAAEQGIKFDFKAYEVLLEKTREQSREARTNIQA
jgi:alanyl-tRNA synthetase